MPNSTIVAALRVLTTKAKVRRAKLCSQHGQRCN